MHIILLGRMPAAGEHRLRELLGADHRVDVIREPGAATEQLSLFATADVIVGGPITPEIAAQAKQLKLFHVFRGGIDGLGIEHLPDAVTVANTFHHEVGVAEFAVMSCLVLPRRIPVYDAQLRRGDWSGSVMWGEPPDYATLSESSVLVVGAGHIGINIIKRLKAFGPRVVAVSRNARRSVQGADKVVDYGQLNQALADADFVVLSVRLAPETTGLIGAPELDAMKSSAFLINVARGTVVDQHALYAALKSGSIAGAAIDVWYNYPSARDQMCLPSDAPLHELDNVLLSPNRSSWSTRMLNGRIADVAENVQRLATNQELINVAKPGRTTS